MLAGLQVSPLQVPVAKQEGLSVFVSDMLGTAVLSLALHLDQR